MTLEQEQTAFNAQLDRLLESHPGEFVLFKDGKPVEFFATNEQAYEAGLKRFGSDEVFLVGQVRKAPPTSVSLAWAAGVVFG